MLPEHLRKALAKRLGVDEGALRHKTIPPRKPRARPAPGGNVRPAPSRGIPDGYVGIAEIGVRASAGPGAIHDGLAGTKTTWLFPAPIVRHEFGAPASELRMLMLVGDSGEPLVSNGDRILVDTSQRVPAPPGLFVIWDGMGLVFKRGEHIPDSDPPKVIIKSVNQEYQDYERLAEEVNVVGRVVWAGRRL